MNLLRIFPHNSRVQGDAIFLKNVQSCHALPLKLTRCCCLQPQAEQVLNELSSGGVGFAHSYIKERTRHRTGASMQRTKNQSHSQLLMADYGTMGNSLDDCWSTRAWLSISGESELGKVSESQAPATMAGLKLQFVWWQWVWHRFVTHAQLNKRLLSPEPWGTPMIWFPLG